jgi:hypothetical protein
MEKNKKLEQISKIGTDFQNGTNLEIGFFF